MLSESLLHDSYFSQNFTIQHHDSQSRISLGMCSQRSCISRHTDITDIIQPTKEPSLCGIELKFGARCWIPAVAALQQWARIKWSKSQFNQVAAPSCSVERMLEMKKPTWQLTIPCFTAYHLLICYMWSYKGTVSRNTSLSLIPGNLNDCLKVVTMWW